MKVSVLALLATAALTTAGVVPPCDHGATDADDYDVTTLTTTQHMGCSSLCHKYKAGLRSAPAHGDAYVTAVVHDMLHCEMCVSLKVDVLFLRFGVESERARCIAVRGRIQVL